MYDCSVNHTSRLSFVKYKDVKNVAKLLVVSISEGGSTGRTFAAELL